MSTAHVESPTMTAVNLRSLDRKFFSGFAYASIAGVFVGFARTYYLRAYTEAPALSGLVHLHAIIFTCWMLLFAVQTSLVAARRVSLHRTIGFAGIGFAAAMIVIGTLAGLIGARDGWMGPQQARDLEGGVSFFVIPAGDMVLFAAFFGAAIVYRGQPDVHKRLMVLASCGTIMPAAFFRLPLPAAFLLSFSFVLSGPIYDLWSRRRIHNVYKLGVPVIILSQPGRFLLGQTEAWRTFTRWLLQATGMAG